MKVWQLQEAKARLSEVVRKAVAEGVQTITVRGEAQAVVVSKEDFDRMNVPKPSLAEFMRDSPLSGVELDLARDVSPARDVDI